MKIYHFPRCSKSRAGLKYLQEKGYEPQIVQYLKDEPFTKESLNNVLMKMHKHPRDIIRTQEQTYKKQFKGMNFSKEEWIKILVENPRLIQRPIVETAHKAVIGNPPENIDNLL